MLQDFRDYQWKKIDIYLVLLVIGLTYYGAQFIDSAQSGLMARQVQGLMLGVGAMVITALIPYNFILRFYWLIYAACIAILLMVRFFGQSVGSAARWFEIAGFRFQPSELAKILLILFYAQFIMKHKDNLNTVRVILSCVGLIIPPFYLIFDQPDLSTSIMVMVIFAVVMFIGGISYKLVIAAFLVAVPSVIIFINMVLKEGQTILTDYQRNRILAWLQPEKYAMTEAYQTSNAIMAIGSGQLTGKGLNNNVIASVKNGNFISEAQTDFIFAVVGEEAGFIGCCVILGLLFLIVLECIMVARKSKDLAGSIIAGGMAGLIGFQTFINIGVVTGLLPNTGLTLPFVSYGLTSLVSLFIGIGFVINIKLQTPRL
ncbi:MAG: rod shape-determining protein RodA [Lachnospiraceae bacterium]|nr:rod shape-determining protein RodA [Lachnospiraceae bacterium]MCR4685132.1 FtsW/RodA/SpoVE family cell cycle protein [Lachnospiraceae bacterium]